MPKGATQEESNICPKGPFGRLAIYYVPLAGAKRPRGPLAFSPLGIYCGPKGNHNICPPFGHLFPQSGTKRERRVTAISCPRGARRGGIYCQRGPLYITSRSPLGTREQSGPEALYSEGQRSGLRGNDAKPTMRFFVLRSSGPRGAKGLLSPLRGPLNICPKGSLCISNPP